MARVVYSGSLQPKKKADLVEIALALGISDVGTKEDIQIRIRKHLDDNQASLEENPAFAGLFFKRKKAGQPFIHVKPAASPASESAEEISEKKLTSPPSTRITRRHPPREVTPVPEAREVSMMLKNAPISPSEEETCSELPVHTPQKERSVLFTSTPRSILRNIPKPSLELADTTFKTLQTGAEQHARVYLLASRSTLSNSLNISFITALFELLYVLYRVIPWNFLEIHFPRVVDTGDWQLTVPYPPLVTFQSSAFWSVILHWSIPTLIIPTLLGSVISFHPANATSARVLRLLPLDPLSASILRLAAQCGYPYKALDTTVEGIDVIGPQWRILNAAVGVAFAFAEAIFVAPGAFAESRVRQRGGTPRRTVTVEE
ncbi:hypothetical protein J3R83DRAFT_11264 [Lanmaoa asiatica]|nr:hypothetical protein J3R83DRAFT_11264 [Lanmaoa asiatica]